MDYLFLLFKCYVCSILCFKLLRCIPWHALSISHCPLNGYLGFSDAACLARTILWIPGICCQLFAADTGREEMIFQEYQRLVGWPAELGLSKTLLACACMWADPCYSLYMPPERQMTPLEY